MLISVLGLKQPSEHNLEGMLYSLHQCNNTSKQMNVLLLSVLQADALSFGQWLEPEGYEAPAEADNVSSGSEVTQEAKGDVLEEPGD